MSDDKMSDDWMSDDKMSDDWISRAAVGRAVAAVLSLVQSSLYSAVAGGAVRCLRQGGGAAAAREVLSLQAGIRPV
jgi:hypothetical protein